MKIKILTYNIHKGFNINNSRFILSEIRESIKLLDPDIVFLQEVQGVHKAFEKKIKNWPAQHQSEFLAEAVWPHFVYGKNADYPHRDHGNAILSKFPIIHSCNHSLTLHKLEQRGLLHVTLELPEGNKKLHLFNTHINLFHFHRVAQLNLIQTYIRTVIKVEDSFLLAGDFNDWTKRLHNTVKESLAVSELFEHLNGRTAATFPYFFPRLPLDRIYFKNISPLSAAILNDGAWKTLSDHLPLYAEIEV